MCTEKAVKCLPASKTALVGNPVYDQRMPQIIEPTSYSLKHRLVIVSVRVVKVQPLVSGQPLDLFLCSAAVQTERLSGNLTASL
jgi:hypothetical protein